MATRSEPSPSKSGDSTPSVPSGGGGGGVRFGPVKRLPGPRERSILAEDHVRGGRAVLKLLPLDALPDQTRAQLERQADRAADRLAELAGLFYTVEAREGELLAARRFVPGRVLEDRLEEGPLELKTALALIRRVLVQLEAAHAAGLVHGNLTPANLVLDTDGPTASATLVDYGLPRLPPGAIGPSDPPARMAHHISPEQAGLIDAPVSPASDVYLVGLLLYRCIAGASPVGEGDFSQVLRRHLSDQPPSLRRKGHAVPRALDQILARALRADPADRYQTAKGLRADLDALARSLEDEAPAEIVPGTEDVRETLTEPGFVGRWETLERLEAGVLACQQGDGGAVVVEAVSGGGKTRLLEELKVRSIPSDVWTLNGQGLQQEAERPFQVLAGVVDQVVETAEEHPDRIEALRDRLAENAEAVCEAFPALASAFGLDVRDLGPEEFGEERTLSALRSLLDALGTPDQPAVVILDDCQWIDELTVKLLRRWADQAPADGERHTTLVLAYRSDEVGPEAPLRAVDDDLHLKLDPLGDETLTLLLASMGGPLPEAATELVTDLAEGNPFMATAVLRGLIETGALVHDGQAWRVDHERLDEAVTSEQAVAFLDHRLDLLDEPALELLKTAAVLGKRFSVARAATMAEHSLDEARDHLEEALDRQILWDTSDAGACRFAHDKLREAVLDRLAPERRRSLHRKAAHEIEAEPGEDLYTLAYHYDAAGDPERALRFALPAAERARDRFALELAESQYRIAERGLEVADRGTRRRVVHGLGRTLLLRGRYDQARPYLAEALELSDEAFNRAKMLTELGDLCFKQGDVEQAGTFLEDGLRTLDEPVPETTIGLWLRVLWALIVQAAHTLFPDRTRGHRDPQAAQAEHDMLAVRMYSRVGHVYWFQRGAVPTLFAHLQELNLAEAYPPSLELAQAYSEHAPVTTMLPWYERGIAYGQRALEIRRREEDLWGQGQSLSFLGVVYYAATRYEEALDSAREALSILERTGDLWEANTARWHIALCHYRLGHLADAVRVARETYESAKEIGDLQAQRIALGIWSKASEGRVPAAPVRELLEDEPEDVHAHAEVAMGEAVRRLEDDPEGAVNVLEAAIERVDERGLRQEYVAPLRPWLATARRKQAETAWTQADRQAALEAAEAAARDARKLARHYRNNRPHALRETAIIAAMQGHEDDAREAFEDALQAARDQGARYEAALTRRARGRVGIHLGWPDADAERRAAEQDLDQLRQGVAQAAGQTDKDEVTLSLLERFNAVLEAGRSIAAALSEDEVHEAARTAALTLLRGDACTVFGVDDEGEPTGPLGPLSDHDALDRELARQAVGTGAAVTALSAGVEEPSEGRSAHRSALCVPIYARDAPHACLYVTHDEISGLFGEEERRLARFVATLAGAALENAENFRELETLNRTLEHRVEARTQQLRQRAKALERSNQEWEQFGYVVAHDLQEPIRMITSYAQMLEERYGDQLDEEAEECIEYVVDGARRMHELIRGLLTYSRVDTRASTPEPVDANAVLEEVLSSLTVRIQETGATITHDELPTVEADDAQLGQVFQNLLSNAIKFTPEDRTPRVHVGAQVEGDLCEFWVSDNGPGIDPKQNERIFVIFQQLHGPGEHEGQGIGLSVTRKIVERHGGEIWVDTGDDPDGPTSGAEPEGGTTFRFTLPVPEEGKEPP